MRIVIDGRLWAETGPGRYIRNLVTQLGKIDPVNEYHLLLLKDDYERVDLPSNFKKVLADFRWYSLAEQIKLPRILKKINPDLVHFPHFNVPIFYNQRLRPFTGLKGKYVVTIHDLIHHHFQMRRATTRNPLAYRLKRLGYDKAFRQAVFASIKIITPSQFVKKQLVDEYKIEKNKVYVTYEGADESLINLAKQEKIGDFSKTAAKFNIQKPYLFYVGNAHPHKNLPRLIAAFGKVRKQFPKTSLVLSGPDHHFWQQLKEEVNTEGIIFTGFVADRELVSLYKNAAVYVMPSLEEGFGIPLLEAMACGCPVVSSRAGSLMEVGGDAALYFNPEDEAEMAEKITRVLEDKKLKESMVKKGEDRVKEFSWKKMAKETVNIYNNTFVEKK